MCDFEESSQLTQWLYNPSLLVSVRIRANREAREALSRRYAAAAAATADEAKKPGGDDEPVVSVQWYASGYQQRILSGTEEPEGPPSPDVDATTTSSSDVPPPLSPHEELLLVQFYSSRLMSLIGPHSPVPRLRRDVKVVATAALIFRRFFLSNSVMVHDPKSIMVASAFLASKVEDATVDIRYLEDGTKEMKAHVTIPEIINAELNLLTGVHFELLCFHPYKSVLAYTEDLRTYLKSEKGRRLATFPTSSTPDQIRPVVGEDLRPMHDEARKIVDDVIVSDIPLMYTPGLVGLAALMVANDELQRRDDNVPMDTDGGDGSRVLPKIDLKGYVRARFENRTRDEHEWIVGQLEDLCDMLRGLREGKFGCGNHGVDMESLKAVHKKLKKCRAWGEEKDGGKKKKKKKRKAAAGGSDEAPPDAKIAKMS